MIQALSYVKNVLIIAKFVLLLKNALSAMKDMGLTQSKLLVHLFAIINVKDAKLLL